MAVERTDRFATSVERKLRVLVTGRPEGGRILVVDATEE